MTQTHSDGGVYSFSYVTSGGFVDESTMTAPNGAQTTWKFNTDGYIEEKVTPDGSYLYNKAAGTNELNSVTDPLARTTTYTYYSTTDARNGLVETITDPPGRFTTYEYASQYGLPTRIFVKEDAAAPEILTETNIRYTFDPITGGVVMAEIVDALQSRTIGTYNASGLPVSTTTPLTSKLTLCPHVTQSVTKPPRTPRTPLLP